MVLVVLVVLLVTTLGTASEARADRVVDFTLGLLEAQLANSRASPRRATVCRLID
jgi:hypothetical protein